MAKAFIESCLNSADLSKACEQQKQLSYFTESEIQSSVLTTEYINDWANRKYQTNDYFLNFVKSIFKEENFLLFSKYLRFPLPSSKIVKNNIQPNLRKVLYAENAVFEYNVNNVSKDEVFEVLKPNDFNKDLFNGLLYRHNDIIIDDKDEDGAYRYFLDINLVKSIDVNDGVINKIAFNGSSIINNELVNGIVYIDDKVYSIYDTDFNLISETPHELGLCPATFISDVRFNNNDVIRESPFSFVREELEEYVFLKTLQKITDPNGAFPIVTMLDADDEDGNDDTDGYPTYDDQMSSQRSKEHGTNPPQNGGVMQAGTVYKVPVIEKQDGSLDISSVENYVNFHYVPTEILTYIDTRLKDIKESIITTVIGDVVSSNEESKNESQIKMGVSTLENQLNELSEQLTRIRTISDRNVLNLQFGEGSVDHLFIHYGTDFYLDSIYKMMKDFEFAPNPIERKDVLVRINQNKYKNNEGKKARQMLLYDLLPYSADKDFTVAITNNFVTPNNMELQLRFNFWISKFEAQYGDIVQFASVIEGSENEKITLINNLLINLIKTEVDENIARTNKESNES